MNKWSKNKVLKLRLISGFFLLFFSYLTVFVFSSEVFEALIACLTLTAAWEWTALLPCQRTLFRWIWLLGFALFYGAVFYFRPLPLIFISVFLWLINLYWTYSYPEKTRQWGYFWLLTFWGAVILSAMGLSLMEIQAHEGPWLLFYLLLLIASADTGAYFSGKAFGRHFLIPAVSPKKTWEGVIGGLIASQIVAFVFALTLPSRPVSGFLWYLLAWFTVLISIEGDLFISVLKRRVGLKDTGHILPGHGGILDRYDSMTAAAPLFYLGLILSQRM